MRCQTIVSVWHLWDTFHEHCKATDIGVTHEKNKINPGRDKVNIEGLVQDCSNYIANTLQLLQSCIKWLI